MKVLHISTECYPAAKAGGMGDVVGALPKFLPEFKVDASVVIPKYKTKWIKNQKWKTLHKIPLEMDGIKYEASVQFLKDSTLGFPLFTIDIPGLFDRESIYLGEDGNGYSDEIPRYVAFQRVVLDWLLIENEFEILHCHDHMTGLITFMVKYCKKYEPLKHLTTILTIHNGQYRGIMDWEWKRLLPDYDEKDGGVLDWDGQIHSLATAIKCAHAFTTVSPSYMEEFIENSDRLTPLMESEKHKAVGIINGIDDVSWDPSTDPKIDYHIKKSIPYFKSKNKTALAEEYGFKTKPILVGFIGRFAYQKGADLLAKAYEQILQKDKSFHFFILGSGDKKLEEEMIQLQEKFPKNVTSVIAYNETLAHRVYASCDYLIMPSRFEPCGLNQMYAMRYATIPIVRHTGGLKDTVPDIGDDGNGISFVQDTVEDIVYSLERSKELYTNKKALKSLREKIKDINFSWSNSAKLYSQLYKNISK
jgi:starch synthase